MTCTSMDQVRTACVHEVDGPCVDDLQSTMTYLHEQGGRGMAGSKNTVQMKNTVTTIAIRSVTANHFSH